MWKTIDIVPSSIREDPQVIAACEAIDSELQEIYDEIPDIAFWPNLDKVSGPLLDVLMWEYHVDIHQQLVDGAPLTDQDKRNLIERSIIWHQKKGTKWIVEQVLHTGWPTADVIEWFEYGGNPYFFRIIIDQDVDPITLGRMSDAVMAVKNVRSWLEGIIRSRQSKLQLYTGQIDRFRNLIRIHMLTKIDPIVDGMDYYGIGTHLRTIYDVGAPTYP
jgi:P2-related tail formation protein